MKYLLSLTVLIFTSLNAYSSIEAIRKTKRVAVVYIGTTNDISASSFGHIALRLSPKHEPSFGDAVVEFVADVPETENPFKKYTKGIGLPGYAYPVISKISPFYDFKKVNQIGQDRDVEIFEIDMTQDQIEDFVEMIIDYKTQIKAEDYTFFQKNCSYFSLLFLERALGIEIDKKSYPWAAKEILQEMGVIKSVISYKRGSIKRSQLAQKSFDKYKIHESFPVKTWKKSFLRMIQKNEYHYKISAYLKLLATFNSPDTPPLIKRRIKKLVSSLKSFELSTFNYIIGEFFKSPKDKVIIPLEPQIHDIRTNTNLLKTYQHKYLIKNNKLHISVKISRTKGARSRLGNKVKVSTKTFEIPGINFNPLTKSLSYKGHHIGRQIKTKKLDFILSQRLDYGIDIDEKTKTISPIIYLDLSTNIKTPKISYQELRDLGTIALNNTTDFKGTGGTCKAMVLLQKAMTERAIFLKDGTYKESVDKIELLKALLNGDYAVISGFTGIRDFTASIDKERLKNFIINFQNNHVNKSMQEQVFENVQHQTEMTKETFQHIRALLKEGILLVFDIGKFHKDSMMWAKNVGHSILVYDIEDNGDGRYKMTAYNPNDGTNINKLYKINDSFYLEHILYPKEFDFRAGVSKLEKDKIELDNAVRSRTINYQSLKFSQQTGDGTIIVPRHKIHRLLK